MEEDRRKVLCGVTPEGLSLLERLDAPLDAWDEVLLERFSETELERFILALDRVRSTMADLQEEFYSDTT